MTNLTAYEDHWQSILGCWVYSQANNTPKFYVLIEYFLDCDHMFPSLPQRPHTILASKGCVCVVFLSSSLFKLGGISQCGGNIDYQVPNKLIIIKTQKLSDIYD